MAKKQENVLGKLFSKVANRITSVLTPGHEQDEGSRPPLLKLIFFIIDWHRIKDVSAIFTTEKVRFHFISKARGTASSDILDLLGIGASEKAVVLCLEQAVMVPLILREVRKRLGPHSAGAGIAFTVPLSGINSPLLGVFKESIHKSEKLTQLLEGEKTMASDTKHEHKETRLEIKNDLIISVINHGFSDEFMATARTAGAGGGTVINARGLAHEGPVKFFGVSVQEEKEIIIILTNREKKTAIMQILSQNHGLNSKAEGIIFSLPVDQVMSLNLLTDL
ncbi:MAG: hypothetical protein LBT11_01025 [Treponema sp.]|jgi:nitrogen regulatory protein PII|nr:hypothetical protein [Treponema sp.]